MWLKGEVRTFYKLIKVKKIHFIGIGGISMSGLAEILLKDGYSISGSDMKNSPIIEKLSNIGIKVFTEHSEKNITNPDLIVYTAAIKEDNPELLKAKQLCIPCVDRATLLGEIMNRYKCPIACSGTHGKTTTTSMITSIMIEADTNPTAHIGGILPAINDSTLVGGNNIFITEACEYVESFLKFNPFLGIILNIEEDHLDYFKNLEHIKDSFSKFIKKINPDGYLVANIDDKNVSDILDKANCQLVTYGISNPQAQWQAKDISFDKLGCASYSVYRNNTEFMKLTLAVPGVHNISNSLASIAACVSVCEDVTPEAISRAFQTFKGARRRFELKGIINGIKVVDDYAHHPTEITATLKAARENSPKRIISVFQPHTYSRTKALLNDFSKAFDCADLIIITDIYAAREKDPGDIHSKNIVELMSQKGKNVKYISSFNEIVDFLIKNCTDGDLVITMGAGNIDSVGDLFVSNYSHK